MSFITDQRLDQLQAATKAQIITAIDNKLAAMTKKQIIEFIFDPVDRFQDTPTWTYRADGQPLIMIEVTRDALAAKLGSKRVTWTYYVSGEIDTIVISTLDPADVVTKTKTIKHYKAGRQPTVTEI